MKALSPSPLTHLNTCLRPIRNHISSSVASEDNLNQCDPTESSFHFLGSGGVVIFKKP